MNAGTASQVVGQHDRSGKPSPDVVVCLLCGVERRQLGRHLKAAHGYDTTNYLDEYPGALIDAPASRVRSVVCRARQAAAARQRWSDPAARQEQSVKLKLAAPWKGKELSDEHKKAISQGRLSNHPEGLRIRPARKPRPHSGGEAHGGFRKDLKHLCRSSVEANFARVLKQEGVPYEHAPQVYALPSGWTPRFRLLKPLWNLVPAGWIEAVGWRQRDGFLPEATARRVAEFEEVLAEQVIILCPGDPTWEAIEAIYATKTPGWESR